ncbi:MAG TPA: zf-TFIIB domain-containing protein [Actinomycetes bacterium]|nr:zf-TFIIB domain-containing protein [Actinomycetes bacterium]
MATDLICPKCQGRMRTYERSGVHLDQCTDCRGIFLDRGELEHLVDAEQGWERSHSAPRERERAYERERGSSFPNPFGGERHDDDDDDDDDRRRYGSSSHRRRKKSFFDELFD